MEVPKRILIYGVTGSGKTTLAARLSRATGLPWHSVDDLTWEPNWTEVPLEIQRERIRAICDQDEWILDTAYARWMDIPLERAELIVALDYPRWVSFGRLLRRCVQRIVDRMPICNGNRETLLNTLSKDSILMWHFRSFRHKRERIRQWDGDPAMPKVLRFTRPTELERWLASLKVVL